MQDWYPSAVMDLVVHAGNDALGALAPEWTQVWERDPSATLFQRPEYFGAWVPEFAQDRKISVVDVRRDGTLAGIIALSVDPDGVLRFLGDPAVTDYFGPVCEPSDRDPVAQAVIDAAAQIDGWERAEFLGLAVDSGWPDALTRAAKTAGFSVQERKQDVCPRVTLTGTYEDYLASLDGKLRHEVRRKARKLEREAGSFNVRLSQPDTLHADLEHFFEMVRTSEGPKGHFLHWGMAGFFTLLSRAFQQQNWLRFTLLEIDGEPLAASISFSAKGTWAVYNASYSASRRELAPGMVLMSECIRLATEEGCHTFDLMRGDEPYKYRFGAVDVPLHALTIERGR